MNKNKVEVKVGRFVRWNARWYEVFAIDSDKGTFLGFGRWACASEFTSVRHTRPKEFACPVCGSSIRVERIDDGRSEFDVDVFTGELIETYGSSNGRTTVYCSASVNHALGALKDIILDQI